MFSMNRTFEKLNINNLKIKHEELSHMLECVLALRLRAITGP